MNAKGKCKKASAEGECRKASADKEHTQDPNTLGGSDHVRISKCLRQSSARGRREGFPQMGVPTMRVRAESVRLHLLFYKNGFEHQQKVKQNRTKTRFLKKFDIRREPKGSQREPKGSQREPKIKKIIKFFSLSFFF